MVQKKGLGKGLNSLLGSNNILSSSENDNNEKVMELDINKITPNKNQPRTIFNEISLQELADSITEVGVLQPITVKKIDDYYEIIAGERRWRASRIAGLKTIPAIVKDLEGLKALEAALIENIQREDLNPIEEALTYVRFSQEFNLSQEEIAKKVGKSRPSIANAMRLLNLDKRVQTFVKECKLSNGHARALLSINNNDLQFELAEKIIEEELSVRQTEELIKIALESKNNEETRKITHNPEAARTYLALAKDLKTIFGTKVNIKNGKNKGKIEIEYYSQDELDRLIGMFKQMQ
jgi:ParB-like protein